MVDAAILNGFGICVIPEFFQMMKKIIVGSEKWYQNFATLSWMQA
jgi:hypothetical protein